uniref:HTH_Tnp_Tc3_2 domain-containing protein n=1 Tax=Heterorhabditis bacteriophora TaxID=37862 RepID=A0A1I7WEU7_HETBA
MSKGKNITPNHQVQIAKKLKLSRCAIQNAIKHINKFGMLENASRNRRLSDVLLTQLLPYARSQTLGRNWDNDLKHSSNWPSQSPALNPIVHLWNDTKKPSNIKALEVAQISVQRCANLLSRISGILRSISYVLTYCYCCC